MHKKKRKQYLRSFHVDGKREIASFHIETRQPANAKNWRENRGHVFIFAVRISRIRDAKSLYYLLSAKVRTSALKVLQAC